MVSDEILHKLCAYLACYKHFSSKDDWRFHNVIIRGSVICNLLGRILRYGDDPPFEKEITMFTVDTSALADFQQGLYDKIVKGIPFSDSDKKRLNGVNAENVWINTASSIAPNNLVIRQYVIQDHHDFCSERCLQIVRMLRLLTRCTDQSAPMLLLESYSYWKYMKPFLVVYANKFARDDVRGLSIKSFTQRIDEGFQATAYLRGDVLYPAPFGDLRDEPLEDCLQDRSKVQSSVNIFPVTKLGNHYEIEGCAVGLNGHIQTKNSEAMIVDGVPMPFKWYNGYESKYPTWQSQVANTFNFKRIFSIGACL